MVRTIALTEAFHKANNIWAHYEHDKNDLLIIDMISP